MLDPLNSAKMKRRSLLVLMIIMSVYAQTYVILSFLGDRQQEITGAFRLAYKGYPLPAGPDALVWQPRFIYFNVRNSFDGSTVVESNFLGYMFAPLIYIDRWLFHKSKALMPPP